MSVWSRWLNVTLGNTGRRLRPSPQEERILRLAEWIEGDTAQAAPAKAAARPAEPQKVQ
jgi:hypothetical protein